jgi:hypothetical protein
MSALTSMCYGVNCSFLTGLPSSLERIALSGVTGVRVA